MQSLFQKLQGSYKFEPILNLANSSVYGFELLAMNKPKNWLTHDLRTIAMLGMINRASPSHVQDEIISVNLTAESIMTITDAQIEQAARNRPKLVIEWVEIKDDSQTIIEVGRKLERWREQFDIKIAIDDMGKGQDAIERFLAVTPDLAKFDGLLLHEARVSDKHYRAIQWMSKWCRDEGVPIVMEWIENERDFEIAVECGCNYGQGYYIQDQVNEAIIEERKLVM